LGRLGLVAHVDVNKGVDVMDDWKVLCPSLEEDILEEWHTPEVAYWRT